MTNPTPEAMRAAHLLNWYENGKPRYHCEHCSGGVCEPCSADLIDRAIDLPALLAKADLAEVRLREVEETNESLMAMETRAEQAEALAKCLRAERNTAEADSEEKALVMQRQEESLLALRRQLADTEARLERAERIAARVQPHHELHHVVEERLRAALAVFAFEAQRMNNPPGYFRVLLDLLLYDEQTQRWEIRDLGALAESAPKETEKCG